LRRSLAIEQGDTLVASLEEGRIVLEKREKVFARVRRRFEKVPREVSLADELISERREEARREQAGEWASLVPYSCALDASALLGLLHEEPGADIVEPLLEDAVISSVNWSEVVQKSLARGVELDGLREDLQALGLVIVPFAVEDAEASARLHGETAEFGLSLADRACLALSSKLAIPALTADEAWAELEIEAVSVRLIR
jgi:ribonuclease VapC